MSHKVGTSQNRRRFLAALGSGIAASACSPIQPAAPAISHAALRPKLTHGVQSGDLGPEGGVLWARADRPARLWAEVSTCGSGSETVRLPPVLVTERTNFSGKLMLPPQPRGQKLRYTVRCESLERSGIYSQDVYGTLATLPQPGKPLRFVWGGDTAGQGYGIDARHGGMAIYEAMGARSPDFFIHSGDTIYADGPIPDQIPLPDGTIWHNEVGDGVHRVAESLDEFRGRFRYNLRDPALRAFNAAVPGYYHWDDHEVLNNHSPGMDLGADARYAVGSLDLLKARALRAFREMLPVVDARLSPNGTYRRVHLGDLAELFSLDLRSYRSRNQAEPNLSADHPLLGEAQFHWLANGLKASTARWKIIACSQPIGVFIADDWRTGAGMEGIANGRTGAPGYRERSIQRLLADLKAHRVKNLIWLTADVHYAAAHHYHPERAAVTAFDPFWEFVAGPLHAGSFPAGPLDDTFGPQVDFYGGPASDDGVNLAPSAGHQYFGQVDINGISGELTVQIVNRNGETRYTRTLAAR